ncbi:hypothetical protein [Subtercola boreus]|uniref:Peptidase S11 D-alanyl-D-alanine carboxypeptidase A N-terminal domain-containing protein n=1 Tax=Subtercola boreus TaxID=120213 RepID=A0A3E0WCK5_9MICO|nr:hypothetical protein [Subtercola boreus]RFA22094.1 hypothetical protein B7R24_05260 [Subtercola boreus]RFA22274.1 hypothetical protein B7R23_05205 [Subtercola boreus]RFA28137.1 hypothetical protein B7R25_05330 [Subtercola boreus]
MPSTAAHRVRRGIVVAIGTVVILGLGVYGPATLLGPLPAATTTVIDVPATASGAVAPSLPSTGASGVTVASSEAGGAGSAGSGTPAPAAPPAGSVVTAGITDPVPLGGSTKIITALVVLSEHPIVDGTDGSPVVITAEDYADYVAYISQSARAVSFIANESWSERDMLRAMLLGSSNNHSDALARWAFGTMDGYLAAAKTWLAAKGMTGTTVVDATGLSEGSVGTPSDLTRIAQLAFETPVIAEIMAQGSATLLGNRQVENLATYLPDLGVTGLSLSYTDEAGLCLLYRAVVPVAGGATTGGDAAGGGDAAASTDPGTATIYGALLREPDYPTLEADLTALVSSASAGLKPTALTTEGTAYVEYETAWGQMAKGTAASTESRMLWATAPVEHSVSPMTVTTARAGSSVGSVTFPLPGGPVAVPLTLDSALTDPGPLWRLSHPIETISTFIASLG